MEPSVLIRRHMLRTHYPSDGSATVVDNWSNTKDGYVGLTITAPWAEMTPAFFKSLDKAKAGLPLGPISCESLPTNGTPQVLIKIEPDAYRQLTRHMKPGTMQDYIEEALLGEIFVNYFGVTYHRWQQTNDKMHYHITLLPNLSDMLWTKWRPELEKEIRQFMDRRLNIPYTLEQSGTPPDAGFRLEIAAKDFPKIQKAIDEEKQSRGSRFP